MGLGRITRRGVERAVEEFDELGREAFLAKYAFGRARNYFLVSNGRRYDSKAIVAAARALENPEQQAPVPDDFSGGAEDAVLRLLALDFDVSFVDERIVVHALDGAALDAHFDLEGWGSEWRVYFHSRGGTIGTPSARNRDYSDGLKLVLGRLAQLSVTITDVTVDSKVMRGQPPAARRVEHDYPLHLSPASNVSELGDQLKRAQKFVGSSGGSGGGNSTRRICIWIEAGETVGGADLRDHLARSAVPHRGPKAEPAPGSNWSDNEIQIVLDSYFDILKAEAAGVPVIKADVRRTLEALLPGRSKKSIEFKHRNISAVMIELGLPYIRGYEPASNYQRALVPAIERRIAADPTLLDMLEPSTPVRVRVPLRRTAVPKRPKRRRVPRQVDYESVQREQSRVGRKGEEAVYRLEQARLEKAGLSALAARVRWVAREEGDGAGYDIGSFNEDGSELFIEVKATTYGEHTPFYLSAGERAFAEDHIGRYQIHRVYDLDGDAKFYVLVEDVVAQLDLEPITFRATVVGDDP